MRYLPLFFKCSSILKLKNLKFYYNFSRKTIKENVRGNFGRISHVNYTRSKDTHIQFKMSF